MPQNPALRNAIAIALGAIPGALSRYYISEWSKVLFGKDFAYYGTFFINVTGCFLIALFLTINAERFKHLAPEIKLIIATGFCGTYTTFSTYGLETFTQLQKGNFAIALLYWIGSAIVGIIAIQLGVLVGRINKTADT